MADVGGISYSVDIDTAGVMSAQKEATSATSAIGKSMDDMAKKSDQASMQMTRTASSVKSAMGNMKGAVGQLGYQIQDIAVQLQMGSNAMMVFGQQGSQIASIFGPGGAVVGAVLAIASAVGVAFVGAMKEAEMSIDDMIAKVDKLTNSQKAYLTLSLTDKIEEQSKALNTLAFRIDTINNIQAANGKSTDWMTKDLIELKAQYDTLKGSIDGYKDRLKEVNRSYKENIDGTKKAKEEYDSLVQSLGLNITAMTSGERAAALLAAQQKLGKDATKEQREEVERMINRFYDLKDAQEQVKVSAVNHRKEMKIAAQEEKKEEKERQKALDDRRKSLEDYYKWSTDAAQKNRDLQAQVDPMANASINYENQLAALQEAKQKELITEQTFNEQKEALANQYEQNRLAAAEQIYKSQSDANAFIMDSIDALGQASTSTISGLLSGTMSVTEAMQNFANVILNQAVGALVEMGINYVKNEMLSNALAATEQANIASTTASANIAATATQARAAATGSSVSASMAPAAAATSIASWGQAAIIGGAALAGTFALAKVLGGRQYGGPVSADGMYRINETGAPEIFQNSSGQQYMLPNSKGEVISNADATSGGGVNWSINVINNASDSVQVSQSVDNDQRIVNLAISAVSSQLASRTGQVSAGLQRGYNVNGRTR